MSASTPPLILQASTRPRGDTFTAVRHLREKLAARTIDLLDYRINPFDYDQAYPADDQFLAVYREHLLATDHLVFATPVYWYTMSGLLKNYLDRFSDLLISHKDLGRQLRGKRLSVLSVSNDAQPPQHFYSPFADTAQYLGMEYGTLWHARVEGGEVQLTQQLPF